MFLFPLRLNKHHLQAVICQMMSHLKSMIVQTLKKVVYEMKYEQTRDDDISEVRSMILNGKESKDVQKHYLLVDDLVYYLSTVNDDPCLRLFISKHIRNFVVKQYHDQNGHMSVQKTFDSICQKYYCQMCFKT